MNGLSIESTGEVIARPLERTNDIHEKRVGRFQVSGFRVQHDHMSITTRNFHITMTWVISQGGLGNLVVLDGGDDESGAMVMPTERVCFLVRPGDILFMNVHALHGNLALNGMERLATVLYARQRIDKCG